MTVVARGRDFHRRHAVFERVVDEVRHEPVEQRARQRERGAGAQIEREQRGFGGVRRFGGFSGLRVIARGKLLAQELVDFDGRSGVRRLAREFEELLDDVGQGIDVADQARALVFVDQHACAQLQARERRLQIVRDAGEHHRLVVAGFVQAPHHVVE
ncbi:hypothetical protein OKW26_006610 [Paraburkholderia sp. 32]